MVEIVGIVIVCKATWKDAKNTCKVMHAHGLVSCLSSLMTEVGLMFKDRRMSDV